jgi:hypothetical protein
MRSPGRFASEQMAALVFPVSDVPLANPLEGAGDGAGAGAGAGSADGAGAVANGAGAVAAGVGAGVARARGAGVRGVRTGSGSPRGDATAGSGALGEMLIAVSPMTALGVADAVAVASPAANVRSRARSESTADVCRSDEPQAASPTISTETNPRVFIEPVSSN